MVVFGMVGIWCVVFWCYIEGVWVCQGGYLNCVWVVIFGCVECDEVI